MSSQASNPEEEHIPQEPVELSGIRNVAVFASDVETWAIEVEYPEWMSPYEAQGLLLAALRKVSNQIEELNDEEEFEDEDDTDR